MAWISYFFGGAFGFYEHTYVEKKELEREIPARTNWCGERVSDGGCWWGEWKLRLPCKGVDGWMGWDIRLMDHNTLHCTAILPLGLFFFFTYLSRRLMGWGTACFLFLGEGRKILRFCFCGELSFFYLMMIWKWPFMKWHWFFFNSLLNIQVLKIGSGLLKIRLS